MQIEVWSDFSCPFCYIGKVRLENAIKKLGSPDIEVIYKSYQLDPNAPKTTTHNAIDYFMKRKGMARAQVVAMFSQVEKMAALSGLTYHLDKTLPINTFTAHRLAKWARTLGKESEFTSILMNAYFKEGKDIANTDTLIELAKLAGLDTDKARDVIENDTPYKEEVKEELALAQELGISSVPTFVINRKYAISGAQDESLFVQALSQVLKEEQPKFATFSDSNGPTCDDESCDF